MKWFCFQNKRKYNPANLYAENYINDILEGLKAENEITEIPIAFSFLMTSSKTLKMRTARVLQETISKLNHSQLYHLDKVFREKTSLEWTYDWKNISPEKLLLPSMSDEQRLSILGLCTFHPNGYFREKALHALHSFSSGMELSYFILRCNDWVKEVREVARKYVENRLTIKYADDFVQNLPLIFQLRNAKRDNHSELFEKVVTFLSQMEALPSIDRGTKSEISKIRYFCYKVMIYSKTFHKKALVDYLKTEREPHARILLLNEIINDVSQDEFIAYYHLLKKEKSPMIRAKVLERYYSFCPDESIGVLETALVDKSGTIRSIARFLLNKQGMTNFSFYYEDFIEKNSSTNLRGAILGLGEVGSINHIALLLPFLQDSRICIVKAALRAIKRIDTDGNVDKFIEMLEHENKGISKEAMRALLTTHYTNKQDVLYRIYKQPNYEHTQYNVAILLCSLPKWESLKYIIEFYTTQAHRDICNLGRFQLGNWLTNFNRTFDAPSRIQVESINKILEQCGSDLEKSEKRHIEFFIKGF